MDRRGPADRSGDSGGLVDRLLDLAGSRLAAFLVAVIAGGTAGIGAGRVIPPDPQTVRPNPWTSVDAAADRESTRRWVLEQLQHHRDYQERDRARMERFDVRLRAIEVRCASCFRGAEPMSADAGGAD